MTGTTAASAPSAVPTRVVVCRDPEATSALGRALGAEAKAGDLVCLWGDLGAGKTHLAKAFGVGLGVTETITSPSFILMAEYEGRAAALPRRPVPADPGRGRPAGWSAR